MGKRPPKKMTEEEKQEFDELYKYVRDEILGYDSNQSLSKRATLRLKGLKTSKFIENTSIEDGSDYSYKTILLAFKAYRSIIDRAIKGKAFKDENHKINYILKIVEPHINDVYMRLKSLKKAKEEAEKEKVENKSPVGYVNTFKAKETKVNHRLDDLW